MARDTRQARGALFATKLNQGIHREGVERTDGYRVPVTFSTSGYKWKRFDVGLIGMIFGNSKHEVFGNRHGNEIPEKLVSVIDPTQLEQAILGIITALRVDDFVQFTLGSLPSKTTFLRRSSSLTWTTLGDSTQCTA